MAKSIKVYVGALEYDLTNYTTLPINTMDDISKVHDTANLMLPLTPDSILPTVGSDELDLSMPLRPLTRIEITDGSKVYKHYVREDLVDTLYDVGDGELYQHKIGTIEQTKLLELRPVPNITVTQPKSQILYALSPFSSTTSGYPSDTETTVPLVQTSPSTQVTLINGLDMVQALKTYTITVSGSIFVPGAENTNTYTMYIKADAVAIDNKDFTYTFNDDSLEVVVFFTTTYQTSLANETVSVTLDVPVTSLGVTANLDLNILSVIASGTEALTTLEDVLDKTLIAGEVYDMNDTGYTQEITLDTETRSVVSNIISPEFTFTGYTKHKIFEEVGDLIKAIARMEDKVVKYDFINELNRVAWNSVYETKEVKQLTLDQYATALEINAENVIESVERQNVVVEPYASGWFTFRSQADGPDQLTDTTLGIKTRLKQYEIKRIIARGFEVTFSVASTSPVTTEWDITDYVVEQKRWNTLPDLPYALAAERLVVNQGKGNTIYFTSGGDRVKNFGYRAPKLGSASAIYEQAIYQIIASVATQVIGDTVTAVNPNGGAQTIANLLQTQYRVEHVALTTLRSRVHKHDARDYPEKAILFSNETSKINDTEKLGGYAQSLANRTGNRVRTINGVVATRAELPQIGNTVGGTEIVTNVNVEMENGFYAYTATLYNDYTSISSFVGVDSAYRQFEIPDEDVVERQLLYTEPLVLGKLLGDVSHSIITTDGFDELLKPFINTAPTGMSYHTFETRFDAKVPTDPDWNVFDKDAEGPVDIKHVGATTVIKVKTKDNWSVDDNTIDGYDRYNAGTATLHKYQSDYLYKSPFGKYDSARYTIYTDGYVNNTVADANLYPQLSLATVGDKLIEIDVKTLADAREAISFAINLPFFSKIGATTEDVRVYNGMAKYNGFALQDSNADIMAVAWEGVMPSVEELTIGASKFLEATSYSGVTTTATGYAAIDYTINFDSATTRSFVGWGLINKNNNELIYLVKDTILVFAGVTKVYTDRLYLKSDETKGL